MGRIPRIKFPIRRPKSSSSGTESQTKVASGATGSQMPSTSKSDVPTVGGKASLQPKRTPVSDKEIEAVLLGGGI